MTPQDLLERAKEARKAAYAPYSGFRVGAALLGQDGRVYVGCNVENAAYSPSLCAERVAIGRAVADGCRAFAALAVVGGADEEPDDSPCFPCGVCRQVLSEFCGGDLPVYLLQNGQPATFTLAELLPHSFSL